jgi:CelD/BcsL family acetyltransferase involved in cellulose biosynthesis
LRFLGDGKAATDYVRLLGDRQHESLVAETLARWVTSSDFESRFGALDLMLVDGHVGDEHRLISFWNRLVQQGWSSQAVAIESSWQTALPGDWKQLSATFSKSQRRKVNKAFRLRQEGQVAVRWVTELTELQTVWPSFVYLHQRRRHELGQAGCFDRPEFEQFLLHTTRELMEQGRARLIFVEHAGQPLGAALLLQAREKLMMYQSGINPDQRHFEPGHLVNAFALEWANQHGFQEFDFMRGDEPYKQDWGAEPTRLWRTRLVSPRWTSRLKNSAWVATRSLKQLSQRWLQRGSAAEAGHD